MSSYLITGGAGFVGSNFVRFVYAREPDAQVTVLDKLAYSASLESLKDFDGRDGFRFIEGDICNPAVVERAMDGAEVVVNFAAQVAVDRSIDSAGSFLETAVLGVHVLLEAARRRPSLRRFVQISTDEVCGEIRNGSLTEDAPLKPRNPYSAAKLGGEMLAYSYHATHRVPVVITRSTNNYGPYAHPEKVIPLFITNLIDGLPLPVYGSGLQRRDWIHVEDHCAAIHLLSRVGVPGEIYNVAGEEECSNLELARRILAVMDLDDSFLCHVNDRPGHDHRYGLSCDKLKGLGWERRHRYREGLEETIAWYRANEPWWRPLKDRIEPRFLSGYWGGSV